MKNSNCNDGQCSTSNSNDQCSSSDCSDKKDCCSPENMMCELMCITKCAKKELLKEKMKVRLEAKIGKKLDKAAELAVDTLLEMYNAKGDCEATKADAVKKLEALMSE